MKFINRISILLISIICLIGLYMMINNGVDADLLGVWVGTSIVILIILAAIQILSGD